MQLIELSFNRSWDIGEDWTSLCEIASRAAISFSSYATLLSQKNLLEVSVKLSDNDEVQELNATYRGKDKPTNILSFPMMKPEMFSSLEDMEGGEFLLGDLVLAHDICAGEAKDKGISLQDHVSHLIVHGTLHLLGYDHESETDALKMENLEVKTLAKIDIASPYTNASPVR